MSFDHLPDHSNRDRFIKRVRKFGEKVLSWFEISGNIYYPFPYMPMNPMMHPQEISYQGISETPITNIEIAEFRAQLNTHDALSELARTEL